MMIGFFVAESGCGTPLRLEEFIMKRVTTMLVAVAGLFLLFMSGCSSDPVKADIISYSKNTIPLINKFDDEIGKKLDEISKENDKTVFVNKIKNEILPLLKNVRDKVAAVNTKSKELQDVNQMFLGMLNTMETGMVSLAGSIENNNQAMYKDALDKINTCQQTENKFKEAFKVLANKHDVVLE